MPATGGGDFQGINPSETQVLINAVTSHVGGARATAEDYASQFARYGLSTGPVNALLADYAWATGAQGTAMLQRRQGLAAHQPPGNFLPGGWTTTGAGNLADITAATKAGSQRGQILLALLEVGNDSAVLQEMAVLKANDTNVAYMDALVTALGPGGLAKLAPLADGSSASARLIRQTVSTSLATASYGMKLTQDFLNGFGTPPAILAFGSNTPGWDASKLAPFLSHGEYSSQWLSTLTPTVLNQDLAAGSQPPPGYSAIWGAIANNPQFAAQLFHKNKPLLGAYMTGSTRGDLVSDQGFVQFLVTATTPPEGSTNPLFKQNQTDLPRLFLYKPAPEPLIPG